MKFKIVSDSSSNLFSLSDVDYTVDSSTGVREDILDKEVQYGESIDALPSLTAYPFVQGADNVKYYPYINGGWYKHRSPL